MHFKLKIEKFNNIPRVYYYKFILPTNTPNLIELLSINYILLIYKKILFLVLLIFI